MSELFPTLATWRDEVRAAFTPVADRPADAWARVAAAGWLGRFVGDVGGPGVDDMRRLAVLFDEAGRAGVGAALLPRLYAVLVLHELGEHDLARDVAADRSDLVVASAVTESRDPADTSIEAAPSGRAWMVNGQAGHVPGATGASELLVILRSRPFAGRERGLRSYRVPVHTDGVTVTARPTLDDPTAGSVTFRSVAIGDERSLGPSRDAWPALERVLDRVSVLAVAEQLGAADVASELAAAWASSREQWGAPLLDKQAVQHRLADMHVARRGVRGQLDAAIELAGDRAGFAEAAALAKLAAATLLPDVSAGAHQLHGGEGYYADRPLHRRHRRVLGLAAAYGGPAAQRARVARLSGWTPTT